MAERIRTLTLIGSFEPTRVISPFSSTRSSLIWVARGMSPTSSRNMRAAVGVLELAHPIGRGVGERALDVAEQLALEDVLAQRGAVQGHERLVLARAVLVDRLGDQLLARARLALDQHAGVGRRDPLEPLDHVAHLRAVADDALEAELLVEPALQLDVGPPQPGALGGLLGDRAKLLDVQRLEQVVERPLLHRLDRRGDRPVAGHEDHLAVGLGLLGPGEDPEAVDVVHHQVGNNHVEGPVFDQLRPPAVPEVATRQWKPTRSRLSATVSAWASSLSTISTSIGGPVESVLDVVFASSTAMGSMIQHRPPRTGPR